MNVALVRAVCRPVRVNPTESLGVCGGQWQEIDGAEKATCLAFNPWGTLLSVGEKEGLVILWDFSSIPNIIRELGPKKVSSSIPDIKQATSCAWSPDGRILAVACELKAASGSARKGTLLLWEVETSTLLAAVACESMATHIAFAPLSMFTSFTPIDISTAARSVLLSCASGDLQTISWTTSAIDASANGATTLHYIDPSNAMRLHFHTVTIDTVPIFASVGQGDGGAPSASSAPSVPSTRSTAPVVMAKFGSDVIFVVSMKGSIAMLNPHTFEVLGGLSLPSVVISSVDLYVDATSLLVPSTKGVHEVLLLRHAPWMEEGRVYTAGAAVRAPWIMASKSPDRQFVLGIPQPRGLFVGEKGMFMWRCRSKDPTDDDDRNEGNMYHDHRFAGELVAVAWHPTRENLIVVSSAGSVHVLEVPYESSWPGAMYPPGFTLITDNVVYDEPEDEFDMVEPRPPPCPDDPAAAVDVISIDDEDGAWLKYLPASPVTTWNHEAPSFDEDDVSSIFDCMKARPPPPMATAPSTKSKKRKTGGR
ncbi:hypothetical protein H310_11556 [Aphanomyces invadans]|uniref:Anaphase-promoting complex subunit 4 WD40 domain-containing protein n=1 Tax=Aphanomyces invadans TaxID=157072 RepID=A0A024TNM6_9STRA|nr:hypothetical protein H310_11556 [Aphanomyces invadans]ETV94907.1 hypothetical protein H310_11556 [Aphanomyces invadans]|eukprot:XP_008876498.1 hypothetical protein H310_11556 [Aphanomyces invadans]